MIWSSSNTAVVTVSGNRAAAMAPVQVTITATSGSVTGSASLTVNPQLTSISLSLGDQDTVPVKG